MDGQVENIMSLLSIIWAAGGTENHAASAKAHKQSEKHSGKKVNGMQ